jgi:uncharacterized membrane protein (DUF4010 family)
MLAEIETAIGFAAALCIGLLVGIERERRKGRGPHRASAGLRTFAVAALAGAVSMYLGGAVLLAGSALGVAAFAAVGYLRSAEDDPGITTEIALLLTLLLGGLAIRAPALAASLGVVLAVLLAAREPMHGLVTRSLSPHEVRDGLIIATATLVVWPLMPSRYIGPYGALTPRALWTIVVLVLVIAALGHVALRLLGPRFGLSIAGLASGFVSSTATIGAMGGRAVLQPELSRAAASGAILSTVATVVQLAAILAVISPPTLAALAAPLACAGVVAIGYALWFALRDLPRADGASIEVSGSAFSPIAALLFGATVGAILLAAAALNAWLGRQGLNLATGVAGFVDTHAAAASVASLVASSALPASEAAIPILIGVSTNTVSKLVVAGLSGSRAFARQVTPGLLAVVAAAWFGLLVPDWFGR